MQTIIMILSIVGAILCGLVGGYKCYTFLNKPTEVILNNFTEWLLYAVTEAEKELGAGTGQIKLRYVYDMALVKFPNVVKYLSFTAFSNMVDIALDKMKEILKSNGKLQEYIDK